MVAKAVALSAVLVAVLFACSACTSTAPTSAATLGRLAARGLQEPASDICTTNGSTPVPLTGDTRVVAAVNSTWAEANLLHSIAHEHVSS